MCLRECEDCGTGTKAMHRPIGVWDWHVQILECSVMQPQFFFLFIRSYPPFLECNWWDLNVVGSRGKLTVWGLELG
jgi:hypothetical protein